MNASGCAIDLEAVAKFHLYLDEQNRSSAAAGV